MKRIDSYGFDECLYSEINGKIVNMTFNKWYGDFLRVGINSYTLKEYRSIIFRPLWRENGYLDLTHNKNKEKVKAYFCTYYAKNNKISSVVKMLKRKGDQRNLSFGGKSAGWLNRFNIINESPILFRNVPQYISMANNLGDEEINGRELLSQLQYVY